ncbi:MAG: hypothetical protein ACYC0B_07315 [Gemmatimonadaceae bacterium]
MAFITILVQAACGAAGGNVAGMLNKGSKLGPGMNTILGAVGGIAGGMALGERLGNLIGNDATGTIAASAMIGLLLPLIGGLLRKS